MKNIFDNAVSNELFFVYGLIALVVVLIIVIIILDKKASKKRNLNLFDTLNMKIIADPYEVEKNNETSEEEIVEIESVSKIDEFENLEPIPEVKITNQNISDMIEKIDEEKTDVLEIDESDLEKTQAQLRVEEITDALNKAVLEDKKDKYEQFEEEQEKNAIISYNELKESFDKLYSENEKIQYLEDDEIPINIEELYKLQTEEEKTNNNKVELEDFSDFGSSDKKVETTQSGFKSSPYISPVYGIQTPPIEVNHSGDTELESANQFLQNLKELKNNLD